MKLIEADKVKRVMKDYWKAQVDKALTLTFIDGNEANKRINSYLEHNHELLKAIDELPSAEPYTTTHDSIPAETGKNDGDRTTNDLISRQAVLNATSTTLRITGKENAETVYGYIKKLCDDIKALPSVQPERKTGHWVETGDEPYDEWECDVCGFAIDGSGCIDPEGYRDVYKFCPNCGADMRGDKHETD